MPSPLLHSAAGAGILLLNGTFPLRTRVRAIVLVMLAALLPDFDFLLGIALRDPNRFHSGQSHSLGFAVAVGVIFGSLAGERRLRIGLLCFASTLLHTVLDSLTLDGRAPLGVPLLWPLSGLRIGYPLLPGVRHGLDGASLREVLREIFSLANLRTLAVELVLASSWIATILAVRTRRSSGVAARGRAARRP